MSVITAEFYESSLLAFARYPDATTGSPLARAYVALGLAGEAGEFGEKAFREGPKSEMDFLDMALELGDVTWYAATTWIETTNLSLQDFFDAAGLVYGDAGYSLKADSPLGAESPFKLTLALMVVTSKIADSIKKGLRDGSEPLCKDGPFEGQAQSTELLCMALLLIYSLAPHCGHRFDMILTENIAKLTSRAARGKLGGSGDNR